MGHILIVEDERIVAMDLEAMVEELGHTVAGVAGDGPEALRLAAETAPHLALMDIRLSGAMDGIETAAELRARFDVPVVYVSAYAGEKTVERAKLTEPVGYIVKPFSLKALRATLETALHRVQAEQRREREPEWIVRALQRVDEAIFIVDGDGVVKHVNAAAQELVGLSQAAVGASLGTLVSEMTVPQRAALGALLTPSGALAALSTREHEVFEQLVLGFNVEEIAETLDISVHTVRNHRKAIFAKLQVHSQVKLMRRYLSLAEATS